MIRFREGFAHRTATSTGRSLVPSIREAQHTQNAEIVKLRGEYSIILFNEEGRKGDNSNSNLNFVKIDKFCKELEQ